MDTTDPNEFVLWTLFGFECLGSSAMSIVPRGRQGGEKKKHTPFHSVPVATQQWHVNTVENTEEENRNTEMCLSEPGQCGGKMCDHQMKCVWMAGMTCKGRIEWNFGFPIDEYM